MSIKIITSLDTNQQTNGAWICYLLASLIESSVANRPRESNVNHLISASNYSWKPNDKIFQESSYQKSINYLVGNDDHIGLWTISTVSSTPGIQ